MRAQDPSESRLPSTLFHVVVTTPALLYLGSPFLFVAAVANLWLILIHPLAGLLIPLAAGALFGFVPSDFRGRLSIRARALLALAGVAMAGPQPRCCFRPSAVAFTASN